MECPVMDIMLFLLERLVAGREIWKAIQAVYSSYRRGQQGMEGLLQYLFRRSPFRSLVVEVGELYEKQVRSSHPPPGDEDKFCKRLKLAMLDYWEQQGRKAPPSSPPSDHS
jgi:hypothetical protein